MKKRTSFFLLFCLCSLFAFAQNTKPFVIPELKTWESAQGTLDMAKGGRIVYVKSHPELKATAEAFAKDLKTMFGTKWSVSAGNAVRPGDIWLVVSDRKAKESNEEYSIRIDNNVIVNAPTSTGAYWATRTLLQMLEATKGESLPCGTIQDWPDYPVRGFMLDVARKFIPLCYLQDLVQIMSYYKMNTFQIHLNDNGFKQYFDHDWNKTYAAFRLECDTYPGLTAEDGFYTKQEFIGLQKLAESKHVNIIPEIDAPAHALAFAHYKPELGSKDYGMDHLDLSNPDIYPFMDGLYKEYLEGDEPVFRGPQVNVGTDEYSNRDSVVVEQFRHFTDHCIREVEKYGKQAAMWGALTHAKGVTPVKVDNVIMNLWYNGYAQPRDMVKLGYKLISMPDGFLYIVPAAGYYYDYLNTPFLYKEWTPARVGGEQFDEKDPNILGGMFAVWNDHCGNGISTKDIHDRIYPALQTLSVKMWTGAKPTVAFEDFDKQRHSLSEAPGVNQGGRIGTGKGVVFEQAKVKPGSTLPVREAGYGYRVEFDLDGTEEAAGTELFRSPLAVFYLSDPVSGLMGFARDGYLNTFPYRVKAGKVHVAVEGDNKATRLFVDGKLVEELNIRTIGFNEGKDKMKQVRTLVFPLEQAGKFKSTVTNLRVSYKE